MGKKPHPLAARIKRVMQADDEVGKIAQATPFLMERALELFLQHLCERASDVAQQRGAKTVTPSHLKHVVNSDQLLDFLKDALASAADLAEGVSEAPKPKRQRAEKKEPREPKAAKTGREAAEGAGTGAEGDALQESVADVTAAEAARIASGPSPFALADAQAGAPVGELLAAEALATYGGAQEQEYDDDYD
ncbi:Dr1-associated corepressor [Monoraphidium neglectum]|uniref:Dr1-associated corepressor n=1 Tax=Monoraphidium neglectum TaxID=145388 RepID=A0A0D2N2G8_9CHLO|nr:Dr1-associated corepressor [Monoraphidium neglectum]KIZ06617.1 Dr1-associated corepressor [Monoraphidium neglectum]|eukprot:XP_013905636.1 Dr1-associated corepressor [Monoraphidium neglectum]